MKIRHLISLCLINIFLLFAVSIITEYIELRRTLQSVKATVALSSDMAVVTATRSEEFFSTEYANLLASGGGSLDTTISSVSIGSGLGNGGDRQLVSTINLWDGNSWGTYNAYILAMAYEKNGNSIFNIKPVYDGILASGVTMEDIYTYLFGVDNGSGSTFSSSDTEALFGSNGMGNDIPSPTIAWASLRSDTGAGKSVGSNLRNPSSSFQEFYDTVGKDVVALSTLKYKSDTAGSDFGFKTDLYGNVRSELVPALSKMGLQLSPNNKLGTNFGTVNHAGAVGVEDNFFALVHYGYYKAPGAAATAVPQATSYVLTPYSLGVTYIPPYVYKATFEANLANMIRFNKTKTSDVATQFTDSYNAAMGCISTNVYDGGTDAQGRHVSSAAAYEHENHADAHIMNDGNVEYDFDSIQCKIDYTTINIYDPAYSKTVARLFGGIPGKTENEFLPELCDDLKGTDNLMAQTGIGGSYSYLTDADKKKLGNRVVAKITTKVKLHIPYKSPVLQWFAHLDPAANAVGENHLDIPSWDPTTDSIVTDDSGVWYVYTTYAAISR